MKSSDYLAPLLGNETFKRDAAALLDSPRPPQGLLLLAPDGCGRNFAAELLAAAYLRDEAGLAARGAHPDFISVSGEGASGQIPVKAVRAAAFELSLSAVMAEGRRCCLIRDAFMLNASSSAALLKTLEEPPEGVMFILTARSKSELLPTVCSRLACLSLLPAGGAEVKKALRARYSALRPSELEEIALLSAGRVGVAFKLASSEEERALALAASDICRLSLKGQRLAVMSALDAYKSRAQLGSVFSYLLLRLAGELERNPRAAEALSLVHEAALEALRGLGKNINQKLLCTRFALRCGENGSLK
ncbi:MAG: hypothetical protein Q4B42_01085 [Oscillospiraceae bacterium]|nr:hypothetical protein [Oscillospiraceae bacterium]